MATQDMSKVKEDIVKFLETNGPSLPIPIAKHAKVESLFASAFLSELLSNRKIKITNMKVGSSPVYYVPGTEAGLEKYSEYLKSKEKEAYLLLKEHKFLEDANEHPAIRVALREIKDFAKHFEANGKLIWRYYLTPQSEYNQISDTSQQIPAKDTNTKQDTLTEKKTIRDSEGLMENTKGINSEKSKEENISPNVPSSILNDVKKTLEPEKKKSEDITQTANLPKEEVKPTNLTKPSVEEQEQNAVGEAETKERTQEKPKLNPILKNPKNTIAAIYKLPTTNSFVNPLAQKPEIKKPKEKPKSEFVIKVMEQIVDNGWTIIEEISHKAKEYNALIEVNSDLGPIIFMTQAKDKKTVSENDFIKLLGEAQTIPLPALFLAHAEPKKKAQEFLDKYTSVMKYKKID